MADPLIIDSDVRFTLKHTLDSGHACDVVWDYSVTVTPGSAAARASAIQSLANNLASYWIIEVMPLLGSDLTFTGVTWVDLDSESGTTGTAIGSNPNVAPKAGGSSAASMPAQVAALVHKPSTGGRGTRQGRSYIPGIPTTAADADGNGPSSSFISSLGTALNQVRTATTYTQGTNPQISTFLGVAHDKAKAITPVLTNLTVDPMFATQRRRLRG